MSVQMGEKTELEGGREQGRKKRKGFQTFRVTLPYLPLLGIGV